MTIEYKDSKRIISSPAEYKIHTFNADSTFTLSSGSGNINYVIIGGGAGGGGASNNSDAGGGGAGQYKTGTLAISSARGYTIDVGAGGAGGVISSGSADGNNGVNGSYSRFDDGGAEQIQSDGGGYGAGQRGAAGNSGGSGGGGSGETGGASGAGGSANGVGTNAGGSANVRDGGGGGGAGGAGANGVSGTGVGHGGIGVVNPLSGSTSGVLSGGSYYLAAGGGGGRATGGTGGGGNGSQGSGASPVSGAGVANTGSGGGGGHENYDAGGAGGEGVIIISYVDDGSITATGGTITTGGSAVQSKPTNVQDNSILIEKDTAKRYWATLAPTFEDDFTSDKSWVETGTQFTIDTSTNHRIDFALKRDGADHEVYKDLTSVSDTAWVLRMHLNFTGNTSADAYNKTTFFGLSSTNSAFTATQDAIGMTLTWGVDDTFQSLDVNGSALNSPANTSNFSTSFSSTDEYWVEIIRESATSFTVELFSDATYSTSVEKETVTTSSAVTGLRYITAKMRNSTSKTEIQNGWLDDIKFYNGVTTPTPTATWTPSYPDDISNLYAWYDANDSTTITKSSDRVSAWTNKEGTSVRDLNQGTSGSQPLWVSADKNGKDVIDFASSRYILTDADLASVSSATTTFIVTQIPASSGNINHSMSNRNSTTWHPLYKEDNNTIRVSNTSGGAYVIDNPPSLESWTYATIIANGTSGFVRTNGALEVTTPTSPSGSANAFVGLSVGRYEDIAGSYWNEKIAEIIIYDRLLTTSEIEGVESYLKVKWGL